MVWDDLGEFIDDQAIAHLDHQHFAYAKHPIIDQERSYFALQVDQAGASFDNIWVFGTGGHPEQKSNLEKSRPNGTISIPEIHSRRTRHPQTKPSRPLPHGEILSGELVNQVELLDQEKKTRYPEVFSSSSKEAKKKLQELANNYTKTIRIQRDSLAPPSELSVRSKSTCSIKCPN